MAKRNSKLQIHKVENGDVFVPISSALGHYYLQFRASKIYNLLGIWRVLEPTVEAHPSDVYVGEVTPWAIENKNSDSMLLPFEDIEVIKKMAKKMLNGELRIPVKKEDTKLK